MLEIVTQPRRLKRTGKKPKNFLLDKKRDEAMAALSGADCSSRQVPRHMAETD